MGIKKKVNNENIFSENLYSQVFLLANFDKLLTWARTDLLRPLTFGLVRRNASNL